MKFGRLTLIRETEQRRRGGAVGLFLCDCGAEKIAPMTYVRSGNLKSCGCLRTKHGYARHSTMSAEYRAWEAMHARCAATSGRDFEAYRSRGISVCDRWSDFRTFLADVGPKPTPKHSLGRENNDLGYFPGNCRWETPAQQMANTRISKVWTIRGHIFASVRQAAKHFGVDQKTIRYWVKTKKDNCHAANRY